MKHRKGSLLWMLMSLVTLLAACGTPEPSAGGDSGPAVKADKDGKKPVTIRLWYRWPESEEAMKQTIQEFREQYPHITVDMPAVASQQYQAQLQAAISGNDLPDIIANHNSAPLDQLQQLGLVRDLEDLITPEKRKEFYEGTWTEGFTTMGGKVYAVPHFTPRRYAHVMYYNLDVLQKAGLTEKDVPKTWDEMIAVGEKIKQIGGDVYPLILGVKTDWLMTGMIAQMATAISPDVIPNDQFNLKKGEYEYHSPGIAETYKFIKKLQDDKILHPNSLVIQYREASSLFAGGKAAFVIDGTFLSSELQMNNKFNNFGVAPLPTKDGKPQYYAFQGETKASMYVKKDTKHYEEVKLFLQFVMDKFYPKLLEQGVEGSPIIAHNESVKVNNPQFMQAQEIQDKAFILAPHPYTRNISAISVFTEFNGKKPKENLGKILEGYLAGQVKDIDARLAQLSDDANKAFQEAIKKVNGSGKSISPDTYKFPNWTPFEPYASGKYQELK